MRNTTDVLRRAFDSTLANWPLIAIRIAENFVLIMIVVVSIVAAVVPVAVAAGMSHFDFTRGEEPADVIATLAVEHWVLILYILGIATVVLAVLIAIHSFVDAGAALVFIDAERNAGASPANRNAFRAFNVDRWLQGGRGSWWSVFWIYNIVWGLGGLIIIIPLMLTLVLMFIVSDTSGRVVTACGGLFFTFLIGLPLAIVLALITQKAIAVTVSRSAAATASVRLGWREIRADFGRHLAVAFIVFVIMIGGAMVISLFTAPLSFVRSIGSAPFTSIAFAPTQIISSIAQTVFSAAVGLWFLAAYVEMTEER